MNYAKKFEEWCNYYDPKNIEIKKLTKFVDFKNKKVLEAGCGTGRLTFKLAPFAKNLVAIDINKRMINFCKKKLKNSRFRNKIKFVQMDMGKMNFSKNSFDVIVFSWSLDEPQSRNIGKILRDSYKILRDGGFVVAIQAHISEWSKQSHILAGTKYTKEDAESNKRKIKRTLIKILRNCKIVPVKSYYLFPNKEKAIEMHLFGLREYAKVKFDSKDVRKLSNLLLLNVDKNGKTKVYDMANIFISKK